MVSCRLSAAGFRFLVILCPPGRSASLTVSPPATATTTGPDPGGVSTFRTLKLRPGWAPSIARGQVVLVQTGHDHRPAPGASQRRVPLPRHNLHLCAALLDEPSTRVQAIRPSSLPLARRHRMDRQRLRLSPELRTPRLLAAHVGAGTDLLGTGPK